jgi:hypothetical protein
MEMGLFEAIWTTLPISEGNCGSCRNHKIYIEVIYYGVTAVTGNYHFYGTSMAGGFFAGSVFIINLVTN